MKALVITLILLLQVNVYAQNRQYIESIENTGTFQLKYVTVDEATHKQIKLYQKIQETDSREFMPGTKEQHFEQCVFTYFENTLHDGKKAWNGTGKLETQRYAYYMEAYYKYYQFLSKKRIEHIKYLMSIIDLDSAKEQISYKNKERKIYEYKIVKDVFFTSEFKYNALNKHNLYNGIGNFKSDFFSLDNIALFGNYNRMGDNEETKHELSNNMRVNWDNNVSFIGKDRIPKETEEEMKNEYKDLKNIRLISISINVNENYRFLSGKWGDSKGFTNQTGIFLSFICERID